MPDVGCRVGSLLFRVEPSPRALLHTPGTSCTPPALSGAVCCLRRDMIGSALPPFRVSLSRGCKVHFMLGPRLCFPPRPPYGGLRALDTPLRHGDLAPCPGSATRRAGAYRGGTSTRWPDTAWLHPTTHEALAFRTQHALSIPTWPTLFRLRNVQVIGSPNLVNTNFSRHFSPPAA